MQSEPNKSFPPSPRELIVVAHPKARLRVTDKGVESLAHYDVKALNELLSKPGRRLRPLFRPGKKLPQKGDDRRRTALPARTKSALDIGGGIRRVLNILGKLLFGWAKPRRIKEDVAPPDLSIYFRLFAPDGELESLARQLCGQPAIDAAYVKPGAVPAVWPDRTSEEEQAPGQYSSDSTPEPLIEFAQRYLGDPPEGLGARRVWELYPGADGTGVNIIDIEGGWRLTHADLQVNQGGLVGGTQNDDPAWTRHGTAVLGILSGDENEFGITGVCPKACVQVVSNIDTTTDWSTATAIQYAADQLNPGDIILIELQHAGPPHFETGIGNIPAEWWEDTLRAIQYATCAGVVVVEAGGNGGRNLNDEIYDTGPFGGSWRNPFRRDPFNDSGAIIVGAGAPPEGTQAVSMERDRSRLEISNYGAVFDAQGWGAHVETCGGVGEISLRNLIGLGDVDAEDWKYTNSFSGTSSAAAMVAGAIACIQGALKGNEQLPLTPSAVRELLRHEDLGSRQQKPSGRRGDAVSQFIGSRPNLIAMIAHVVTRHQDEVVSTAEN